ncbi:MAG TPA: NAD(P)/FAD-dependent oxidoreductase [Thermomicrobiales bacterium]|nr:NAD(P)/FAD-dependent oxidoreductase [Thermomicrobiales bacterium]
MDAIDVEAIVIGAGPAGSAAAIELARRGPDVLLLDRATFPRDKPCGDLIGVRAMALARALGVDEQPLRPYAPLRGAFISADRGSVDLTPATALGRFAAQRGDARVVPRTVFDAALVKAALAAGARVRRVAVREVTDWRNGARSVRGADAEEPIELRARCVIVAGGYGCRVAANTAAPVDGAEPARGIAVRGYWSGVDAPPGRIVFALDRWLLPGYGWVFPLPDGGANVGVGALVGRSAPREPLRDLYARFTSDPASPAFPWLRGAYERDRPRSWPLDLGPRRRRLVADGLLVAGEAAALVGPLTGAGIYFAMASGALAGRTLAAALASGRADRDALRDYGAIVRRQRAPWLRAELLAQRWLGDPNRLERVLAATRAMPGAPAIGGWVLLHLG